MINKLCRENHRNYCKFAYSRLKDHHHAEDAVQEAYAKASKYASSYSEGTNVEAWFFTILRNSIRSIQSEVRNGGIVMEARPQYFPVELFDDESLNKFDLKSEIEDYDGAGDSKEKLRLHFVLGYTAPQVADFMSCSIVSVYSVVSGFKRKMKEKYRRE